MQIFTNNDKKAFDEKIKANKNPQKYDRIYLDKTIKYINFIKWIPWLLFVWVWNSLSMNAGTKESDIDLFIVTKTNRMWLNRILITLIFQVLWVRKTKKKHAWRFCLSFFATDKWLYFWSFALEDDLYLYFWIVYLKPILDYNNTYNLFIKSQSWACFDYFNEIIEENKNFIKYKKETKSNSKVLDKVDQLLKNIFLPKTLKNYEKLWKPYWIIINDDMLKFHNNDIRKKIKKDSLD